MSRLIVFICCLITLVLILNLKNDGSLKVSNDRFDFKESEKRYHEFKKELQALKNKPDKVSKKLVIKTVFPFKLDSEQLKRGHTLYKKCIICHGKMGEGKVSQKAPKIAGQKPAYIVKELVRMKKGERVNKLMLPYIKPLSMQDFKDLANYLSKFSW